MLYQRLVIAAALTTWVLIVVGAVVRVTGSGLGCPDWPQCHGQLLPPPDMAAILEYSHRVVAAIDSVLLLAVVAMTWLTRREQRGVLIAATAIPLLLTGQIALGAVTVLLELPPAIVLVHLLTALVILGLLVFMAVQGAASPAKPALDPRVRNTAVLSSVCAVAGFLLLFSGSLVRATGATWACRGFPACNGDLLPFGVDGLMDIHLAHRLAAYAFIALLGVCLIQAWSLRGSIPALRWLVPATGVAIAAQFVIGAGAVSSGVPAVLRGAHVAGAAAVWAFTVALATLLFRELGRGRNPMELSETLEGNSVGGHPSSQVPRYPQHAIRAESPGRSGTGPVAPALVPAPPRTVNGPVGPAATAGAGGAGSAHRLVPGQQASMAGLDPVAPRLLPDTVQDSAPRDGAGAAHQDSLTLSHLARAYLTLTKPGIIVLLLVTTGTSMMVAANGIPPLGLVLATLLGGALSAGAANTFNCYIDRDIDALMTRTARRPLVSGVISPPHALVFGLTLAVLAVLVLGVLVNWLAAFLSLSGLLYYVFVYTCWLKRSTPANIVIGGAAGAVPPLVGWAAVTGELSLLAVYLFAVIFFWTPPHFWALALLIRREYERASVPMLPNVRGEDATRHQILVYAIVLVGLTLAVVFDPHIGVFYISAAAALGGLFLYYAVRLLREATPRAARGMFRYSILYLALLFVALVIDQWRTT